MTDQFGGTVLDIEAAVEVVERRLNDELGNTWPLLNDLLLHLVSAGGKRLRPRLVLAAARALRPELPPGVEDRVLQCAVIIEMLHLGSLVHDDVIDEADVRRGIPTVSASWDNLVAVLTGDVLFARTSSLSAALGADEAALTARTLEELCVGQIRESERLFDPARDVEHYLATVAGKTGSLMSACCEIAALQCSTSDAGASLAAFGCDLGIGFQIIDDVLDLVASEEQLGKRPGTDLLEGVYTLPVILAAVDDEGLRQRLGGPVPDDHLDEVRNVVLRSGAVAAALDQAAAYQRRAEAHLRDAIRDPQAAAPLRAIAARVMEPLESLRTTAAAVGV